MNRYAIGEAVPRVEDEAHLTGMGHFVDDLALNGQCHGYVLRSPVGAAARTVAVANVEANETECLERVEQAVAELESAANQWFETDWTEFRTAVEAFGLTLFGD